MRTILCLCALGTIIEAATLLTTPYSDESPNPAIRSPPPDSQQGQQLYCDPRPQALQTWETADEDYMLVGELVGMSDRKLIFRQQDHYLAWNKEMFFPSEIERATQMQQGQITSVERPPSSQTSDSSGESSDHISTASYSCVPPETVMEQTLESPDTAKIQPQNESQKRQIEQAKKTDETFQKAFDKLEKKHRNVNWERVQYKVGDAFIYVSAGVGGLNPMTWGHSFHVVGSNLKQNALWDKHKEHARKKRKAAKKTAKKEGKKAAKEALKQSKTAGGSEKYVPIPGADASPTHREEEAEDIFNPHIAEGKPNCVTKSTFDEAIDRFIPDFDSKKHAKEAFVHAYSCFDQEEFNHAVQEHLTGQEFSDSLAEMTGGLFHLPGFG